MGAPCRRRRPARCARGSGRGAARCRRARARRGLEHRLQVGGDRALAVGAGDVDDRRQRSCGIAELRQQPLDAAERQVDQLRMQRLHLGEELGRSSAFGPQLAVRPLGVRAASDGRGRVLASFEGADGSVRRRPSVARCVPCRVVSPSPRSAPRWRSRPRSAARRRCASRSACRRRACR